MSGFLSEDDVWERWKRGLQFWTTPVCLQKKYCGPFCISHSLFCKLNLFAQQCFQLTFLPVKYSANWTHWCGITSYPLVSGGSFSSHFLFCLSHTHTCTHTYSNCIIKSSVSCLFPSVIECGNLIAIQGLKIHDRENKSQRQREKIKTLRSWG